MAAHDGGCVGQAAGNGVLIEEHRRHLTLKTRSFYKVIAFKKLWSADKSQASYPDDDARYGSLMRRVLNHLVIDKRSGYVLHRAGGGA